MCDLRCKVKYLTWTEDVWLLHGGRTKDEMDLPECSMLRGDLLKITVTLQLLVGEKKKNRFMKIVFDGL